MAPNYWRLQSNYHSRQNLKNSITYCAEILCYRKTAVTFRYFIPEVKTILDKNYFEIAYSL